jgi:hypothetical protein
MSTEEMNLKDSSNYHFLCEDQFETISKKYMEIINYYILHSKINMKTTNYIFLKGIYVITNIFKIIYYYTKNLDITVNYSNKAAFYYIEYVNQINEKDSEFVFVNLNLKDAIIYVYRKSIYEINDSYKKNVVNNKHEEILFDSINNFTLFYCQIIQFIFNKINIANIDEKELDSSLLNIYYFLVNLSKNDSSDINTDILNLLNRKTIKKKNIIFKNMIDTKFTYSGTNDLKTIVNHICIDIECKIKENNGLSF